MLTHFSLFTGIGGIDLAAEWAGFETVGQCEWADYPTKVLEKHWPNVPRWRNVRDVTKQSVEAKGIRDITLISGGFPCQPFSVAGKRRGQNDDRYLWPEMFRVINEIRPHWVLGENVPGIVNMALGKVLTDLESVGYEVQTFNIPACAVDAPHRRARIFIVAHSGRCGLPGNNRGRARKKFENGCQDVANSNFERRGTRRAEQKIWNGESGVASGGSYVADTNCQRFQNVQRSRQDAKQPGDRTTCCSSWWDVEPELGRVANGIPHRVDRLKCLGNAVVPQQVYPILQMIADIERGDSP